MKEQRIESLERRTEDLEDWCEHNETEINRLQRGMTVTAIILAVLVFFLTLAINVSATPGTAPPSNKVLSSSGTGTSYLWVLDYEATFITQTNSFVCIKAHKRIINPPTNNNKQKIKDFYKITKFQCVNNDLINYTEYNNLYLRYGKKIIGIIRDDNYFK